MDPADEPWYISPDLYRPVLTDITEDTLDHVAKELNYEDSWRIDEPKKGNGCVSSGLVYGRNSRIFLPLTVETPDGKISRTVIFLVDTTSPYTYVSRMTLCLLGKSPGNTSDRSIELKIEDGTVWAHKSRDSFSKIDILGSDFFFSTYRNFQLTIEYGCRHVELG